MRTEAEASGSRKSRNADSHQKMQRPRKDPPPEVLEGARACPPLPGPQTSDLCSYENACLLSTALVSEYDT